MRRLSDRGRRRHGLPVATVAIMLSCGCGPKSCGHSSPAPREEPVPVFTPATPPQLLLIKAPVHDLRGASDGLLLLVAPTWSANPSELAIERRPRGGGPATRIARTGPHASLIGSAGGEVVWSERNVSDAGVVGYSLHAAPLAGGPVRDLAPGGLDLAQSLVIDRGRILGRGASSADGVLLALPLSGGSPEVVARAGDPSIRSRAEWIRSGCDAYGGAGELPAVRAGADLFLAASLRAGDVVDLRAIEDEKRTVVLCKVGADGLLDVVAARYGDDVTLLGADGDAVVAAVDGEVEIFDHGRESPRAPLPRRGRMTGSAVSAGEVFVLIDGTLYRLRRNADRFDVLVEHALSFALDGDRVFTRMIDGVASVPLP